MQLLTVTTPALIFPVVSLFFISFNARFLTLANRIRTLVDEWEKTQDAALRANIEAQLHDLKFRVKLIRTAQFTGALSLLFSVISCLVLLWLPDAQNFALYAFSISLVCLVFAVTELLREIAKSTSTLRLVLQRIPAFK